MPQRRIIQDLFVNKSLMRFAVTAKSDLATLKAVNALPLLSGRSTLENKFLFACEVTRTSGIDRLK